MCPIPKSGTHPSNFRPSEKENHVVWSGTDQATWFFFQEKRAKYAGPARTSVLGCFFSKKHKKVCRRQTPTPCNRPSYKKRRLPVPRDPRRKISKKWKIFHFWRFFRLEKSPKNLQIAEGDLRKLTKERPCREAAHSDHQK